MIPVIDIFAGPGGLSEGFSAIAGYDGTPVFGVVLSIEKDPHAFQTLKLRSFFRRFAPDDVPMDYYRFLRGQIGLDDLYERCPREAAESARRTWQAELGHQSCPTRQVRQRIDGVLHGTSKWVLIGGPPCQTYSIAGRSRNRRNKRYKPTKDVRQRLYVEYLQILADHRPAAFVMENVKGLLSATLENKCIFHRILQDLRDPTTALKREGRGALRGRAHHYQVFSIVERQMFENGDLQGSVIQAERYGVPQARHRVILLGLRDDLRGVIPEVLRIREPVPVQRVLDGMPAVRSGLSRRIDTSEVWIECLRSQVSSRWANAGTVRAAGTELRRELRRQLAAVAPPQFDRGGEFVPALSSADYEPAWFLDERIGGTCNHSTRAHMDRDLHRYMYAACYAQVYGQSPFLRDFPTDLLPDHVNVDFALSEGGNFSDRFRVQVADRPSTTIMSHIHKDGHYYIHYDPTQCRSLTVREAARLQTFPDNYFFCGPRTAQYIQVGNAVPPLLAKQVGEIVHDALQQAGATF